MNDSINDSTIYKNKSFIKNKNIFTSNIILLFLNIIANTKFEIGPAIYTNI